MDPSALPLQQSLQAQFNALLAKRDTIPVSDTKTDADISAALTKMQHQLDVIGNLKLVALPDNLKAALGAVSDSDQQLTQDLQDVTNTGNFITSMSAYLGCVDKAIDLMKTVALA